MEVFFHERWKSCLEFLGYYYYFFLVKKMEGN